LPGYIEPLKNVTRQQLYFGKWELIAHNNTTTEVKFSALSVSKSGIPRFIRDPIIQRKLLNSFSSLKELSSEKVTAVAEQSTVLSVHSAINW
jgi:glutamine amidotransferase PdxT